MSKKTVFGLLLASVGAGCFLVGNREVKVNKKEPYCPRLPKSFEGKRLLILSDLHKKRYGDSFNNLMAYCKCQSPDYIFFLGDLFSRDETDMRPKAYFMSCLQSIAPTYYIVGNHELFQPECLAALCEKLKQMGVTVLCNQKVRLTQNSEHINLYGLKLPLRYYINSSWHYSDLPVPSADYLESKLGKAEKDQCNFLLAHNPFFFEQYAKWGADVTFSGHCHGGIVRIPLIGGVLSPERKFFPKYTKGIYNSKIYAQQRKLVVTSGLGKLRFNNPSEILVCTLRKGCEKNA